ncbi:MAG: hypothetical protein WCE38_18865 [Burkholderiales bacterium]
MRGLSFPALLLSLVACVSGMNEYEGSGQQWQEEVELQDGRVIVVTRTTYYSAYCGPGVRCVTSRGHETRGKIEFEHAGERVVWVEKMRPIILQVDRDDPVVVGTFRSCGQYNSYYYELYGKLDYTAPLYLAFRYKGGKWHKLPVEELTFPLEANLLVNSEGFGSWTSLKRKQELNSRFGLNRAYLRVYPRRRVCQ